MSNQFIPKNVLEDLVSLKLDQLLKLTNTCSCERCRADVLAIALNKLPSRYVVSTSGGIYTRFEALSPQMQANITAALVSAIEIVKASPRHDIQ